MPTDEQIAEYAKRLPDVYRDIMAAFPEIEPGRKAGYGLAFQTIAVYFINSRKAHSLGDIQVACKRLAEMGFIEIKNQFFAHPTELGEKLIAAITGGTRAPSPNVPSLPQISW
jgi:hypothetical protein